MEVGVVPGVWVRVPPVTVSSLPQAPVARKRSRGFVI